jgi:hypothetical protein
MVLSSVQLYFFCRNAVGLQDLIKFASVRERVLADGVEGDRVQQVD